MIPEEMFIQRYRISIPRESGDDPSDFPQTLLAGKYSPRERG